jgi:hypothetical protein
MPQLPGKLSIRPLSLCLLAAAFLLSWFACTGDELIQPVPGEIAITTVTPGAAPYHSASVGTQPGILFGMMNLDNSLLGDVQTGTWRPLTPANILGELAGARARRGRLIIKLVRGDRKLLNPDGTFSLDIWKSMVNRFTAVDFDSYIADGTVVAHYLIDEPHLTRRWGRVIPQSTIEAMARYSKQRWPGMATVVRVLPSWLAQSTVTYRHLDAAYVQYHSRRGDLVPWMTREVAIAKRLGLGVVLSMNALDGGTSASGIPGFSDGKFAMSAAELRKFGGAMLNESYGCAFLMWNYDPEYNDRSDIQSAMADLSRLARSHAPTSCRQ